MIFETFTAKWHLISNSMACLMGILNAFTDILRSPFPLKHLIIIYYDSNILLCLFSNTSSHYYTMTVTFNWVHFPLNTSFNYTTTVIFCCVHYQTNPLIIIITTFYSPFLITWVHSPLTTSPIYYNIVAGMNQLIPLTVQQLLQFCQHVHYLQGPPGWATK